MQRLFIVFTLTLLAFAIQAQELPYYAPNIIPEKLTQRLDGNLQFYLEEQLNKNPTWRKLIRDKRMAVGLVDLRDIYAPKFANINGNEMMYAASLPKIAVLLAATDAIEKGELKETETVKNDMRFMIAKSNNAATTRMIDRIGYKKIERVLTHSDYKLYDRNMGGGLWVGKRYAAQGARYPDPIKGLSHAATANQVCRFYYKLAKGELVNFKRSEQMLGYLENPQLHHKFINSLEKITPNARFFRKSGSWKTWHSDSVMVWDDEGRQYILVGMVEDAAGEQIMRDLVYAVEEALKDSNRILAQK